MERGKVIIIPDENKILQDYYEKSIVSSHLEAYQDFSDKFKLGYNFTPSDYQTAPITIAEDGHLSVKTVEDNKAVLVIYVPRVITDRQINWYYKNVDTFNKYSVVGAFAVDIKEPIEDLNDINKLINKRNMLYERKEDDVNVRQKI